MSADILFFLSAFAALGSGLAMVLTPNAVYSALFLVGTQITLAVLFLLQGSFFIAALQVIVYAGAIMVLFLFVIMMLGVDRKEALIEPLAGQRPMALTLGVLLVAETVFFIVSDLLKGSGAGIVPASPATPGVGNVEEVARVLFTKWAFPFEVTSVLLVVAVIGVMVLAKRHSSEPSQGESSAVHEDQATPPEFVA